MLDSVAEDDEFEQGFSKQKRFQLSGLGSVDGATGP
jgi:hypothetical protein